MAANELILTYLAFGAIEAHRIVAADDETGLVKQATTATDPILGVSDLGADNKDDVLDVIQGGSADIEYGEPIKFGDKLSSDAEGRAVVAADGERVIGVALLKGIKGDIGEVLISLS